MVAGLGNTGLDVTYQQQEVVQLLRSLLSLLLNDDGLIVGHRHKDQAHYQQGTSNGELERHADITKLPNMPVVNGFHLPE